MPNGSRSLPGRLFVEFLLEALKAPGIVEYGSSGIRQDEVLAGTVNQLLSQFLLQPLEGEGDRRLRTEQLSGCAGEALFRRDGEKYLKGM